VPTSLRIRDPDDFPALYRSTNQASLLGQGFFLRLTKARSAGLLAAAIFGATAWQSGDFHVGAAVAFLAFLVALVVEVVLLNQRPEQVWYEGRAAAESVKTLTWRYMMRADDFQTNGADIDRRFVGAVSEVLRDLPAMSIPTEAGRDLQITQPMRDVRALPFEGRREFYLRFRIQDQQAWYAGKSSWNAVRARRWTFATIVLEFLGLVGAAIKAFGWVELDVLGIFAAAAATAMAWLQTKQHQNLSTAYAVTSQELAAVASDLGSLTDELRWPEFVGDAEEAISREHTLWRASRGIRSRLRID